MTAGDATRPVPRGAGISFISSAHTSHVRSTYSDSDAPAFTALLRRKGMRLAKVAAPVSPSNGNNAQFGNDDSGADCSSDFLGRLDAQANVAL